MFSKEEAKQVRQDFWTFFGKRYDRKWTLYSTKIKDVVLKFSMEDSRAVVSIDMEHAQDFYRHYYFDKLVSLKSVMIDTVSPDLIWDQDYQLDNGKIISRVYVVLNDVKITRKTDWPQVYSFFHDHMDRLESFYWDFKDYIED